MSEIATFHFQAAELVKNQVAFHSSRILRGGQFSGHTIPMDGGQKHKDTESIFWFIGEVDDMKAELLDIDAILSIAVSELSQANPDIKRALALVDEVRDKVLDLAEGLEESQKN